MYTLVVLNTDEALQSLTSRQVRATLWRYRQLAGLLLIGPPRKTLWSVLCDEHCFARVTRRVQDAPPVRCLPTLLQLDSSLAHLQIRIYHSVSHTQSRRCVANVRLLPLQTKLWFQSGMILDAQASLDAVLQGLSGRPLVWSLVDGTPIDIGFSGRGDETHEERNELECSGQAIYHGHQSTIHVAPSGVRVYCCPGRNASSDLSNFSRNNVYCRSAAATIFRDDDRMANVYDVRGATAEWVWRSHTNIFHSLPIIAEASVIELHTHNKTLKPDAVSAAESSQQCT